MRNCVLDSVETMFSKGFWVCMQDDNEIRYPSARRLCRPLPGMDHIVDVHLEGGQHFCCIENLQMYGGGVGWGMGVGVGWGGGWGWGMGGLGDGVEVVSFNGWRYDLQLIKPYVATFYGTHAPPWLHCFQAYEGPEFLADEMDGMLPWDRCGDDNKHPEEGSFHFTAIYTHKLSVTNCRPEASAMPSIFGPTEGLPAWAGDLSSLMNMWTTWASLCNLLPGYVAFYLSLRGEYTHWRTARDDLMANRIMLSCAG